VVDIVPIVLIEARREESRVIRGFPYNFDMLSLRRSLPPVNALLVFEAAARHGNLTAAGTELCIAASAVSRHVSNLERETGLVFFIRSGNRLELTAAGRRLAEAISAGLGHVRDVLSDLKQKAAKRTFTVGCSYDLAHSWLMPRFREIAELVVEQQLRVVTSDLYETFDSADVDLSVRYGNGRWPGFAVVHLFDEEVFPICGPTLLASHPELLNAAPEILMKFPLLQLTSDDGLKWADWLRDQGAELPVVNGPAFTNYSLLMLELVAGRGLGLGYAHIIDHLLLDRRVVRLSDRSIRSDYGMYAVFREADSLPIKTIVNLLRKSAAGSPGGEATST
jgi:LysR family transcriptional regulator, glycine cleavage system transcriptional activator